MMKKQFVLHVYLRTGIWNNICPKSIWQSVYSMYTNVISIMRFKMTETFIYASKQFRPFSL